jgi:hypothetical protein
MKRGLNITVSRESEATVVEQINGLAVLSTRSVAIRVRLSMKTVLSQAGEDLAELWLRLEKLRCALDDVRSAALIVGNMARHKEDHTLGQLAEGLHGVHSTLNCQYNGAVGAIRQCLASDHEGQNEVRRPLLRLVPE